MTNSDKHFDIAVIGGGPGGYPAAIKAAQNGKSVALIEAKEMGGTCLNRGCIPSKALIASAELLKNLERAEEMGIVIGNIGFNYAKAVDRKDRVVEKVRKSLEGLIRANKIEAIQGFGKLVNSKTISIQQKDQTFTISADKIILATGSEPRALPHCPFDGEKILDSTQLLEMKKLPESLLIIGGGVIGCEFASLFAAFGVEVTIVEMMPRLLPLETEGISKAIERAFKKSGIDIHTNSSLDKIEKTEKGVRAFLAGREQTIEAEKVLIAVGRTLNTSNIGLEAALVQTDEKGMVLVNEKMETSVPGIYAVGDIASTWWLAHVASHQGLVAAMNASGKTGRMNYDAVPSVIFTYPEIATVGMTLETAVEKGIPATLAACPFLALGKAQATQHTEGFAQVVVNKETGALLGAQVVGSDASTLIAEMAVAISSELTVDCITETIHAHPTVAEAWMEAAFLAMEEPLHLMPLQKGSP